ncbi:MAG: J domain-containing protein, partial [Planctomycetaceae bacterium]|nr:J domain-containing protein [Planctomycetaceae bacterium]
FNNALNSIFFLFFLIVEICGVWLWITGATRQHRQALKAAGFKWASKKKAWYFRPEQFRSRSRGKSTLEEIRQKYGSDRPVSKSRTMIGA